MQINNRGENMKILYKQQDSNENTAFSSLKINNTYLKQLSVNKDSFGIAGKAHHHTCYEIHLVTAGHQTYRVGNKNYEINANSFLMIPPHTKHKLIDYSNIAEKFSITFITENSKIRSKIAQSFSAQSAGRISENLSFINAEYCKKLSSSTKLIENALFETIVHILRLSGYSEEPSVDFNANENTRLTLAKQFIKDNIELSPTVEDVAKYCNLSTRQLTRLFIDNDTITPLSYIQKHKIKLIQQLLANDTLSLKEISEKLNFNNEYYFNSFFKKYAGMPPGEYRAMHRVEK